MSKFVMNGDVAIADFDWGSAGMRADVPSTGCETFVVMDVNLAPGKLHDFHKHPDQDEMIIVKAGRIVQWLEQDHRELGPGDSVYIDKDVIHGSFNEFGEEAALQVILAPAMGEGGYELVDVSQDEPWASIRA
jgi:quercetin dioxygenase-like cupin family protein